MVKNDALKTTLCGIELDNPLIPASGTFGFGYEFNEIYDAQSGYECKIYTAAEINLIYSIMQHLL